MLRFKRWVEVTREMLRDGWEWDSQVRGTAWAKAKRQDQTWSKMQLWGLWCLWNLNFERWDSRDRQWVRLWMLGILVLDAQCSEEAWRVWVWDDVDRPNISLWHEGKRWIGRGTRLKLKHLHLLQSKYFRTSILCHRLK